MITRCERKKAQQSIEYKMEIWNEELNLSQGSNHYKISLNISFYPITQ